MRPSGRKLIFVRVKMLLSINALTPLFKNWSTSTRMFLIPIDTDTEMNNLLQGHQGTFYLALGAEF